MEDSSVEIKNHIYTMEPASMIDSNNPQLSKCTGSIS